MKCNEGPAVCGQRSRGGILAAGLLVALTLLVGRAAFAQQRGPDAQLAPPEKRTVTLQPVDQPKDYSDSKAYRLESLVDVPETFYSHARTGDIVLENDLARFVFGATPEEEPRYNSKGVLQLRRGNLLDIMTRPSDREAFRTFAPGLQSLDGLRLEVDSIEFAEEENGKASVAVSGHDNKFKALEVRTEYLMYRDFPGLLITTSITNTHESDPSPLVTPSDILLWGYMSSFVPGTGWIRNSTRAEGVEFVYGRHDDLWVMVAPESRSFDVAAVGEAMGLVYADSSPMEPGETRLYRRWLVVSTQDPAYMYSLVLKRLEDADAGSVVGRVIEREQAPDGSMIDRQPVQNADVFITPVIRKDLDPSVFQKFATRPYLIAKTRESGEFDALLPAGEYHIFPATRTRLAPRPNFAARIEDGAVEGLDFGTSKASRLLFEIKDKETGERIPGKITVLPLRGTDPVELGSFGNLFAGNTVFSPHGSGIIELPDGNYRVVASRGPEYHTTEQRVRIRALQDTQKVFELERAFETPGWIGADLGVRTNATPVSSVTPYERVATAVAEGVEWLVTGDTNIATDLSDEAERFSQFLKTSPGYRRDGRVPPFIGDLLLFPVDICSTGENPDFSLVEKATTTQDAIQAMRALCPEAVLTLCRPTWPQIGYLTNQGYDPDLPTLPVGDYTMDFDAVQIWEGKRQGVVDQDYRMYQAILRDGNRMVALGGSNSAGTWMSEPGYPRVYVQSPTDDPSKIDPETLARNIKQGLVTITNGPFVTLTVNDQPIGSTVTDTDGEVELKVEVYSANWSKVNSIRINLNGSMTRQVLLNPALVDEKAGRVFPPKDQPREGTFRVRVKEDAILDLIVEGSLENNMDPVNPFNLFTSEKGAPEGQYPMAFSAPIYIDTDGNGKLDLEKVERIESFESDEADAPF